MIITNSLDILSLAESLFTIINYTEEKQCNGSISEENRYMLHTLDILTQTKHLMYLLKFLFSSQNSVIVLAESGPSGMPPWQQVEQQKFGTKPNA